MKISTKIGVAVTCILSCSAVWLYSSGQLNQAAETSVSVHGPVLSAQPLAQGALSGSKQSGQDRGLVSGCSADRISPFSAHVPLDCSARLAEMSQESQRADHESAVFTAVSEMQAALARGDTEAAAQILGFSHDCGTGSAVLPAGTSASCKLAVDLQANALGLIESEAAKGNPDAKYHLANWLIVSNMADIEQSLADPTAAPNEKLVEAERLLDEAAAGGSQQAKDLSEVRRLASAGAGAPS